MVGTNALAPNADIANVQEWLGHANIATTRLYDRRQSRPEEGSGQNDVHAQHDMSTILPATLEESPTFKVEY